MLQNNIFNRSLLKFIFQLRWFIVEKLYLQIYNTWKVSEQSQMYAKY